MAIGECGTVRDGVKMEGQEAAGKSLRILNRDVIKYIAMLTMLLNHIANIFLGRGTPLYEILEDIGFFTAPVMCFFLVEGYAHTRSKVKYGLRLLLFAALSQIPFRLAFDSGGLNMIYTLFCCFLILAAMENVDSLLLRRGLVFLLTLATVAGDWPIVAPVLTALLAANWGDRKKMAWSFFGNAVIFSILNVQNYMFEEQGDWTTYAVFHGALSGLGIITAGVVTLVFYNGERAEKGRNFSKYFFYIFYPAHLLFLYLVKINLHNI